MAILITQIRPQSEARDVLAAQSISSKAPSSLKEIVHDSQARVDVMLDLLLDLGSGRVV
jgi:hypothetical protein